MPFFMRSLTLILGAFLFLCAKPQSVLAAESDPFVPYTSAFFATLELPVIAQTTNAPSWTTPTGFTIHNQTWTLRVSPAGEESDFQTYSLVPANGIGERSFNICTLPSKDHVIPALTSALNIPCSLPPEILASAYTVSPISPGVFAIRGPRPAYLGTYVFIVCRNSILFMEDYDNHGTETALAILRAGGVNITYEYGKHALSHRNDY